MSDIHLSHRSNQVYWFVMHNLLFNCCFIDIIMLCYCSNVRLMIVSNLSEIWMICVYAHSWLCMF